MKEGYKMNVCVFYYDGFCEFEVVLAVNQFRENNIFSAALENHVYISEEKQKFLPDKTIKELNPDDIDLFIIPGGDSTILYEKTELREFIEFAIELGKVMNIYKNDEEIKCDYNWLKNIKDKK